MVTSMEHQLSWERSRREQVRTPVRKGGNNNNNCFVGDNLVYRCQCAYCGHVVPIGRNKKADNAVKHKDVAVQAPLLILGPSMLVMGLSTCQRVWNIDD